MLKPRQTKADRIRALLAEGFESGEVAAIVGCTVRHVCVLRWNDRNPGYHTEWMRDARKDEGYADRERARERRRYWGNAEYRKRRIAYAAAWRRLRKQREARP